MSKRFAVSKARQKLSRIDFVAGLVLLFAAGIFLAVVPWGGLAVGGAMLLVMGLYWWQGRYVLSPFAELELQEKRLLVHVDGREHAFKWKDIDAIKLCGWHSLVGLFWLNYIIVRENNGRETTFNITGMKRSSLTRELRRMAATYKFEVDVF